MLPALTRATVGYNVDEFWPGALKSVAWKGKTFGVPTNNETMALIWNSGMFRDAGLDPESPPATWDDVVAYSRKIKEKTGKNGFGMGLSRHGARGWSTSCPFSVPPWGRRTTAGHGRGILGPGGPARIPRRILGWGRHRVKAPHLTRPRIGRAPRAPLSR